MAFFAQKDMSVPTVKHGSENTITRIS